MSTLTSQTKVLTNAALKGILSDALVERGTASDLNTLKTPGLYYMGTETSNLPAIGSSYGIVLVTFAGDLVAQLVINLDCRCAYRLTTTWGTYPAWQEVSHNTI